MGNSWNCAFIRNEWTYRKVCSSPGRCSQDPKNPESWQETEVTPQIDPVEEDCISDKTHLSQYSSAEVHGVSCVCLCSASLGRHRAVPGWQEITSPDCSSLWLWNSMCCILIGSLEEVILFGIQGASRYSRVNLLQAVRCFSWSVW